MLKIISTQSAENSPLDMAEDAEGGNGTSSTTRSAQNLPLNMVEDVEVGGNGDGSNNETVEKLPLSKKPKRPTGYLTSLRSSKRWVSFDSFGYGWGSQLETLPK